MTETTTAPSPQPNDSPAQSPSEPKAGGTLLESGSGSGTPNPSPSPAPSDDWRARYGKGDTKRIEALSRYQTEDAFADAFFEARAKLSQRAEPARLADNATPQQIAEYRKGLGLPDVAADAKPDAYLNAFGIKLADGTSDADKTLLSSFAKQAYEAGADPRSVKVATDFYNAQQAEMAKTIETVNVGKKQEWTDTLKRELGKDFEPVVASAEAYMNKLVGEDMALKAEILNAQLPGGGLLGDNPLFVRMLGDLAMQNGFGDRIEANAIEANGKSLAEQHQELEALLTKDPARYNLPETQNKLNKVIELRMKRGELDENGNEARRRRSA